MVKDGVNVKFWTFAGGGVIAFEQARTRGRGGGAEFWSFPENVMIECPHTYLNTMLYNWLHVYTIDAIQLLLFRVKKKKKDEKILMPELFAYNPFNIISFKLC